MRDFIVFRLYGPMASWGDIAVGEFRPSVSCPSRSAIIGILAAALGITRDQEENLALLNDTINFAVKVELYGSILRDYHTVQVPRNVSGNFFFSRKREIEAVSADSKAQATLSQREYYVDALYKVCGWLKNNSGFTSLESLQTALKKPVFPLYLGRKSCPPSLPLAPQIINATSLIEVFERVNFSDADFLGPLPASHVVGIYWDEFDEAGINPQHIITRRDWPLNRHAWQFADRSISYCGVKNQTGGMANVSEQDKTKR